MKKARLKRSESGFAGVRRMLRRETKRALQAIDSAHAPRGEAIHDARKRLKKARAALRLARLGLSKSEYRRENDTVRDAARPLSKVRDSQVLIDTLDGLARRATQAQRRTFLIMRERLTADRRKLRRPRFRDESVSYSLPFALSCSCHALSDTRARDLGSRRTIHHAPAMVRAIAYTPFARASRESAHRSP